MFSVRLLERNFTDPLNAPPVTYEVRRYSFGALGGPRSAEIDVIGQDSAVWEMAEKLRCPVEIINADWDTVWWGYVRSVEINTGQWSVGVSLDTMYNRVAVAYSLVAAGSATVGTRATTAWASNSESNSTYGQKELIASLSGATATQAESARDTLLAQCKYPIPTIQKNAGGQGMRARLICAGWWDTLAWRYYSNTNTASVETTTQLGAIITAGGPLLSSTIIMNASGISSSEYRDGDTLASEEAKRLLKAGTTNYRRLLCTVTKERVARIYEEPVSGTSDYLLLSDGSLRDAWDVPVRADRCVAGVWAKLKDVIPATVDMSKLSDPTHIFIEGAEYNAAQDRYTIEPRNVPTAWEIGQSFGEL